MMNNFYILVTKQIHLTCAIVGQLLLFFECVVCICIFVYLLPPSPQPQVFEILVIIHGIGGALNTHGMTHGDMAHGQSKNLPLRNGIGHYCHKGMAFENIFYGSPFHVEPSKDLA
jgi:hypothetical protein